MRTETQENWWDARPATWESSEDATKTVFARAPSYSVQFSGVRLAYSIT